MVHEREHFDPALHVVLHDGAGAEEPAFFARVEVEFERVFGGVLGGGEDAEGFEDCDDRLVGGGSVSLD